MVDGDPSSDITAVGTRRSCTRGARACRRASCATRSSGRSSRWSGSNAPRCKTESHHFYPLGKPFRMQVKATAPTSRTAKNSLDNFARNATRTAGGESARMSVDMQRIKESIAAQTGEGD